MPSPVNPEHRLTLRQAKGARNDFAAIPDELDYVKGQLSRMPTRAYVSRTNLMATGSALALIAAVALMPVR